MMNYKNPKRVLTFLGFMLIMGSMVLMATPVLRVDANGKNYWAEDCGALCTPTPTASATTTPVTAPKVTVTPGK